MGRSLHQSMLVKDEQVQSGANVLTATVVALISSKWKPWYLERTNSQKVVEQQISRPITWPDLSRCSIPCSGVARYQDTVCGIIDSAVGCDTRRVALRPTSVDVREEGIVLADDWVHGEKLIPNAQCYASGRG